LSFWLDHSDACALASTFTENSESCSTTQVIPHASEMFGRRFANLLLFCVTATELVILFPLTPTFTIADWIYVLQHLVVLGIAVSRPNPTAWDYSIASSTAVIIAYAYLYAQVICLRESPGYVAWPGGGLAVVTFAAGLSLVTLLTLGRLFGEVPLPLLLVYRVLETSRIQGNS